MNKILDGAMDVIVTGRFHDWFDIGTAVRMSAFYGITRDNLIDYAINECDYDVEGDEFDYYFGKEFLYVNK